MTGRTQVADLATAGAACKPRLAYHALLSETMARTPRNHQSLVNGAIPPTCVRTLSPCKRLASQEQRCGTCSRLNAYTVAQLKFITR